MPPDLPPDTIGRLYREYVTMLRRRCLRMVGDSRLAEDITQDVFVTFVEKYGKSLPEKPGALLYTMTTNLALNRIRDARRRGELLAIEGARESAAGSPTPPDAGLDVRRVVAELDPELAAIGIYYYVDGMEQDEIAEVTGLHRRTVSRRLEDFRVAAQKRLEERRRP